MGADSVASWLSAHCSWQHCLRLNLQLHTISLVRTCRISSFCTVAWQLARLLLTRCIARSLGDSWASRIPTGRNWDAWPPQRICSKLFTWGGSPVDFLIRRFLRDFVSVPAPQCSYSASTLLWLWTPSASLTKMSECSLSGRGQGHGSNFYIVDLENFATASRHRWYTQFDCRRFVYDTWDNEPTRSRHGWVHILFMTHCLRLNLQLHTISLLRTCISSFCTIAW